MKKYKRVFQEDLRLSDFKKHSGASDFTKDYIEVRRKLKGPGNKSAKIKSIKVNRKKDYITFIFKSAPTYTKTADAVDTTTLSKQKRVRSYTQEIRVLDFFKWAETKPGFDKKEMTRKEIKEILNVASIQVWCDDPSFEFQGMNYIVSTFDAAIYPETRAPERWNKIHNDDNFLCKHLSMIFNSIDFFLNPMTSMVNKYLKSLK